MLIGKGKNTGLNISPYAHTITLRSELVNGETVTTGILYSDIKYYLINDDGKRTVFIDDHVDGWHMNNCFVTIDKITTEDIGNLTSSLINIFEGNLESELTEP